MTKSPSSSDPQGHLRNLVGQLSVELAQQRAKAGCNASTPAGTPSTSAVALPAHPGPPNLLSAIAPYVNAHATTGSLPLEREAIRTRSYPARDLLALVATRGRYGYGDLASLLECATALDGNPVIMALAGDADPTALLSLARAVSAQRLFATDASIALSLYDFVHTLFPAHEIGTADWINFVGLLVSKGSYARAERILEQSPLAAAEPHEHACLRANLLAAGQQVQGVGHDWIAAINTMFQVDGIEPIDTVPGERPLIDRIFCSAHTQVADGPLVSILMTNYCVGEPLQTAVASVLNQSWRNIELIIVDDCSPDDEFVQLQRLEGTDPRVRVFRTKTNSGTYTGRNLALSHARGDFVTCHDSDDWSHPRKIELQVSDLLHNDTIGNLSRLARTTESLWFERFSATGKYVYPNTSSLMFRREPVISRLGCWDPVRTGADTEFYKRIELVFGKKLGVLPGAPLSFARTRPTALTSGTLGMGWSSPARRDYRASWAHWHSALKQGESDPKLVLDRERHFPAPESILPAATHDPVSTCEILVVADMRCRHHVGSIAAELDAMAGSGLEVAICHVPALRRATAGRELVAPAIQALLNSGRIRRVELDAALECKLVLVRDPTVLQFSSGLDCAIRPERVLIATDLQPFAKGSRQESYTIASVESAVSRLFRQSATWATGHLRVRKRLEQMLPAGSVLAAPWHPILLSPGEVNRRDRPQEEPPVIGFCFPDAKTRWETWGLLDERLFPRNGPRVRVIGGQPGAGSDAASWEILEREDESETDFFSTVDFVPYFPKFQKDEVVSAQLATAIASGCIVLAAPRLAPLLGDGAIYVDVDSVKPMIDSYSSDRAAMEAQSRRARRFAKEHLDPNAYVRRIQQLLSSWSAS